MISNCCSSLNPSLNSKIIQGGCASSTQAKNQITMNKQSPLNLNISEFRQHKNYWTDIARKNGWYAEPFHIHVWIDPDGNVVDSVATRHMESDYAFNADTDLPIGAIVLK